MTSQTITIPTQPQANEPFTLHYNNPTYVPTYSTSNTNFVLKNTNGNTVSNVFVNPPNGVEIISSSISLENSCSYLIHDSQYNYYFTNNKSFFINTGIYYVYIYNQIYGTQIFINDPELTDSCPIGLAIDNSGFFYVALQASNKIIRYDPSTYSFGNRITNGTTILTTTEGLNGPCGLKFDSNNYLYVANRTANTVLKYDISNIGPPILLQTITDSNFIEPIALHLLTFQTPIVI